MCHTELPPSILLQHMTNAFSMKIRGPQHLRDDVKMVLIAYLSDFILGNATIEGKSTATFILLS